MVEMVIEIVVAATTVGGSLWTIARWTARVEAAGKALDRLTDRLDSIAEKFSGQLNDLNVRVTVLESRDKAKR
jgi:hypothetical protein